MPLFPRAPRAALILAATLALGLSSAGAAERAPRTSSASLNGSTATASVIVKYRSGATSAALSGAGGSTVPLAQAQRAAALSGRLGLKLADGPAVGARHQVLTATGISSAALAAQLAKDSDVEYAVPSLKRRISAIVPSDPRYAGGSSQSPVAGQWYLHAADSTLVSAVNAPTAWAVSTGSASIVVAVLDTGVRTDHPDLAGKLLAGYDFVSDSTVANDGNGRDSDPSDPGDWVTAAETRGSTFSGCDVTDSSWHGTQTAGLVAAATNNGVGMAGLGRNVRVLPVRVLGKCFGTDADIIAGMRWAAGLTVAGVPANPNPAQVISMSLGADGSCGSAYQDAIDEIIAAGVTVVAAAGNDSLATNSPANCTGVVGVAGLRHAGTKNGYSSLGSAVSIAAPAGNCVNLTGECLYPISSTSNTGTTTPVAATYTTGGSDYAVGTSFATPLVSATVGLMLSANPSLSVSERTSLLKSTARAFPTTGADSTVAACHEPTGTSASAEQDECYCTTATCGAGMLDAGAAVTAAASGRLVANIVDGSSLVTVGASTTLSGGSSSASSGSAITAYAWQLSSGSSYASLSATAGADTTLSATAAGTALVQLTVTDGNGSATATAVISTGTGSDSGSGGTSDNDDDDGGGGALDGALLAGLGLLLAALLATRRRQG